MDHVKKFGPERKSRTKGEQRNPGRFLKYKDAAGANQLSQGVQHGRWVRKKHQDKPPDGGIEVLVTDDLVHVGLGEADVP
jgi:hypothetical protein